jgi:hypothetical protein
MVYIVITWDNKLNNNSTKKEGSPVYVVIKLQWSDRFIIMINEIPNSS